MTVHNTYLVDQVRLLQTQQATVSGVDSSAKEGLPISLQQIGAAAVLLVLSPLLLLLALLIRLESQGSPLYSQVRVGKDGRRFKFYKFRSMYIKDDPKWVDVSTLNSDRDGICKKFRQDPRITPIGRFIRKFSLDELPQLINILKGDMALIGPRPALPCETDAYNARAMNRLDVTPGLTGLWQVSGRADTTFEEQIDLDMQYIKNRSWWFDISIMAQTVPAVLSSRGAY